MRTLMWTWLAAALGVVAMLAAVAVAGSAGAQQNSDCYVGLVLSHGERCTYSGTSQDFWVDAAGRGHFIFFSAGTGIDARGTTINGVTYYFKASKQADGTWIIEAAGPTTITPPTTTTTTTTTTMPPREADVPRGYSDVAGGVHKPAIDALAELGVFVGTGCDEGFCPDVALDRKTMAVWALYYKNLAANAAEAVPIAA